jgi:hypothetical protein
MQQFDALCPTELDENVLAFDVTQFPEPSRIASTRGAEEAAVPNVK